MKKRPSSRFHHGIIVSGAALLIAALSGCESYDLGAEPTTNVTVSASNPSWSNGIGKLVKAKCANCHRVDRTQFTPANTPTTMDDIGNEEFFNGETNGLNIQLVRSRIFDSPTQPMPPLFADPLSTKESDALKSFLDRILAQAGLNGCPVEETTLTYDDVAVTINENCATAVCHASTSVGRQPLTTLDEVKAARVASLNYLKSNFMPYGGDGDFQATDAGKDLLAWLCAGADVTE